MNGTLPNKVYRRPRKNYPLKRDNYRKYFNAKWTWYDVFCEIDQMKDERNIGDSVELTKKGTKKRKNNDVMKIVSKKYNIKEKTLRNKYKKWNKNGKTEVSVNVEHRGIHKKKFSEDEEKKLYEYIKEVYINNSLFFDDECLELLAKKKWNLLYKDNKNDFKASNGWIYDFKKRWSLSTQTSKRSRKSVSENSEQLKNFLNVSKLRYNELGADIIFNMDETFWRIVNGNINVIGITGSDNRKVFSDTSDKTGFTAVFTVNGAGNFLKPIVIIKGKTKRCLNKIKVEKRNNIELEFSESGWINLKIMEMILREINNIAENKNSVLILDTYSVHCCESIRETAKKLNIELIYVPPGKTSTNQPLDVCINGPMKSIGKRVAKELFLMDPFMKPSINSSLDGLIEAKSKIKRGTIIKSFNVALNLNE